MRRLPLSIAMGNYDRTRALVDGQVTIDGVDPVFMLLSPEEMFFRAFRHAAFDVSELSLSSYAVSVAQGNPHYVAIPVFLSRAFRHTSIYVRDDRGLDTPADLAGRAIGIAEYQLTANVWVRGLLEDDYGVAPTDINWVRGGMDEPGRPEKIGLKLPAGVRIEAAPPDRSLDELLREGVIDGFVGPRAPRCYRDGVPGIRRLFADPMAEAMQYYERTRIFPVMHVLGLRRELAEREPWLPGALLKAFERAKAQAIDALRDTSASKVTMPFVEDHLEKVGRGVGADCWTYGMNGNEHVVDHFCDIHHRQGLSSRRLTAADLFHQASLESYAI